MKTRAVVVSLIFSLLTMGTLSAQPMEMLSGTLTIVHVDQDKPYYLYLLTTDTERLEIHLGAAVDASQLRTGMLIRVYGYRQGQVFHLQSPAALEILQSFQLQTGPLEEAMGDQRVLVILIRSVGRTLPWSQEVIASYYEEADIWMQEVSYGSTSLDVTVTPILPSTLPDTGCSPITIATLARNAAVAAGYVLSAYNRLVYGFPFRSDCSWWGLGSIGGNPSEAWIQGALGNGLSTIIHELGHGLGLHHSHSLECTGGPVRGPCEVEEYGDFFCAMGSGGVRHFNAAQKAILGWLGGPGQPAITDVQTSGLFELSVYASPTPGPKALSVPRSATAFYTLESRAPFGYDDFRGVLVHLDTTPTSLGPYLLDMRPSTETMLDAALARGQVFADASAQVSVMPVSISDDGATLLVAFDTQALEAGIRFSQGTYRNGDHFMITFTALIGEQPAPYAVMKYTIITPDGSQYPSELLIADTQGTAVPLEGTITAELPRGIYTIVLSAAWWNRLDTIQGIVQLQ